MAGNESTGDTAEPGSITLRQFYRSIQDQLVLTIERSLNLGKKSLAGRLDDVLLRQRFWEEDIGLEDGALSDLEANDAVASSIIWRYLDEFRLLLGDINASIAGLNNESIDKDESLSLLYETNTKLCDKIEVFDAIAANGSAEGTRTDTKATTIGQLRLQLEIEDQRLRSQGATTGQLRRQLETEDQRRRSQGGKKIQVDHTQSPNSLRLLYPPEEFGWGAQVDIVAVHGLNVDGVADAQHAWDTWRKPAGPSGRFWLRDDLRQNYTPRARIFLYKYDSARVFGSPDKDHFVDEGNDLLQSVQNERPKDRNRPLIFVAHNLGGILVQQALVNAYHNSKYTSICTSTTGVLFFGTPHGRNGDNSPRALGLAVADAADALSLFRGSTGVGKVWRHLNSGSIFTDLVTTQWRHQMESYQIISFYEEFYHYPPGKRAFFELPSERTVVLDAANRDMCRFDHSKRDQERLELVSSYMKELYENALTKAGSNVAPHQENFYPQPTYSNRVAVQDLPSESADPKKLA